MAKTTADKDVPFGYGADSLTTKTVNDTFTPYKVGDIVTYEVGKRLGTSFGKILTINVANVRVEDYGHYRSTSKDGQPKEVYRKKELVLGLHTESVPAFVPVSTVITEISEEISEENSPELSVIDNESNVVELAVPEEDEERIATAA